MCRRDRCRAALMQSQSIAWEVKSAREVAASDVLDDTLKLYHKLYYLQLYPKFLDSNRNTNYCLDHSTLWLSLTITEQFWALIIRSGTLPHKAVAFAILARKPVDLELVLRTLRGVASIHFRKVAFFFRWPAYGPFLLNLLKRNRYWNLWCVSSWNWIQAESWRT